METGNLHSVGIRASSRNRMLILLVCVVVVGIWLFGARGGPSAVAWVHDYQDAVQQAKQSGRLVLLDFSADWCPPCRQMEQEVFSSPQFAAELEKLVVPLRLDLSDSPLPPPVAEVVALYGVTALPTFVIADTAGRAVAKWEGTMSAERFLDFVRRGADQAAGGRSLGRRN